MLPMLSFLCGQVPALEAALATAEAVRVEEPLGSRFRGTLGSFVCRGLGRCAAEAEGSEASGASGASGVRGESAKSFSAENAAEELQDQAAAEKALQKALKGKDTEAGHKTNDTIDSSQKSDITSHKTKREREREFKFCDLTIARR